MELNTPFEIPAAKVIEHTHSRLNGLTATEVRSRLATNGTNTLPKGKRARWFFLLLSQFNSSMVYILVTASAVSFVLNDKVDAAVILAAVALNIIVGFLQEGKAENSLAKLQEVVSIQAKVLRAGTEQVIDAAQVVVGDILIIEAGDSVPADARLFWVEALEVNEAALTGESEQVRKITDALPTDLVVGDRTNMVFAGTTVMNGKGKAIVTATGIGTEVGKIAATLHATGEEPTPLQKQLSQFSRSLAVVIGVFTLLLFIGGVISGRTLIETFTVAVAVAVSALPEGLVIGMTVILAVGMKRILDVRGLVRKLASAETLGAVTVICTDKTGTLTEGNMRVDHIVTWDHTLQILREHPAKELNELFAVIKIGMLNNDARVLNPEDEVQHWKITGNLTERALLFAGASVGLRHQELQLASPRIHEIAFNSTNKYMATLHTSSQAHNDLLVKGAPEKVLEMCSRLRVSSTDVALTAKHRQRLTADFVSMSSKGLRVLALAYAQVPKKVQKITPDAFQDLVFAGFLGIKDGLRAEAKTSLAACQQAGIRVLMITGDHRLTAQAIARELGLPSADENIMDGAQISKMNEAELHEALKKASVCSRVSPQDKYVIVKHLKRNGEVVAMTGDGVNDAPALKAADIGVALGSGTDVAKSASDLILLDDNFETVVAAVKEGRVIYANMKKSVLFLVSSSFTEAITVAIAILFGLPLPLAAAQILWINLVTDTFPNLALTREPEEATVMQEPPRAATAHIIDRQLVYLTTLVSGTMGLGNLALFSIVYHFSDSLGLAQTMTFVSVSVCSLLLIFSVKNVRTAVWKTSPLNNPTLLVCLLIAFLLVLIATYLPALQMVLHTLALGVNHWLIILGTSVLLLGIVEACKYFFISYTYGHSRTA